MEYLVLGSYIEFEKKVKTGWIEGWKKVFSVLGIFNTILFLIMILSASTSFLFLFLPSKHRTIIACVCILIEFISVVIISFTTQGKAVLKQSADIKKLDTKYDSIKEWLESIGFKEKNQIKQLCRRCEIEVEKNNEKKLERKKFRDRIFNIFLFPMFIAILAWIFDLKFDLADRMMIAIWIAMIGIVLDLLVYGVLYYLMPIIDRENIKMYKMVKDIQGVLDRKFPIENEDIV